jgi:hypothetical protein
MWASGKVRIDLSLFSSLSASGQPILRLRNLTIPCARIL